MLAWSLAAWAGPPITPMSPPIMQQREVMESAYGSHYSYNELTQVSRGRYFAVESYSSKLGDYEETRVMIQQDVNAPTFYGYRYVSCPVPESALGVKSTAAEIDVTFDTEGPDCYGWGYQYYFDTGLTEDWFFYGEVTLQAQLLSPGFEQTQKFNETSTQTDNISGTSYTYRQQCSGGYGWNMLGGGFTMFGESIFGEFWYPFDTDEADAQFSYNKCMRMDK
jgi:hypothetical protein